MKINSNSNIYKNQHISGTDKNQIPEEKTNLPVDSVEIGKGEDSHLTDCRKVWGTVGTGVGVTAGRVAVPVLTSMAAGSLAGRFIGGTVGTVAGAVLGFAAGAFLEFKGKIGRVAGGMAGGILGSAAGAVASKIPGYTPSETLVKETKGFSIKSLFKKLRDPFYTSHKKLTSEEAKEVLKNIQPGDFIISTDDGNFRFEMTQKLLGKTGDWTHIGIMGDEKNDDKKVLEILISEDGPVKSNPERLFTENNHVMILRPDYKNPESVRKTLQEARDYLNKRWYKITKDDIKALKSDINTDKLKALRDKEFEKSEDLEKELQKSGFTPDEITKILDKSRKKIQYDFSFRMGTDDKHYCQEYIYKAVHNGSPEIDLKPSKFLGMEFLTADDFIESPDVKEIYNSGSNFWINLLSKYD